MTCKHLLLFSGFHSPSLLVLVLFFYPLSPENCVIVLQSLLCPFVSTKVANLVYQAVRNCEYFLKLDVLRGNGDLRCPACQEQISSVLSYSARGQEPSLREQTISAGSRWGSISYTAVWLYNFGCLPWYLSLCNSGYLMSSLVQCRRNVEKVCLTNHIYSNLNNHRSFESVVDAIFKSPVHFVYPALLSLHFCNLSYLVLSFPLHHHFISVSRVFGGC